MHCIFPAELEHSRGCCYHIGWSSDMHLFCRNQRLILGNICVELWNRRNLLATQNRNVVGNFTYCLIGATITTNIIQLLY